MKSAPCFAAVLLLALVGACTSSPNTPTPPEAASLEPSRMGSIARLHTCGDISMASQPSAADFAEAHQWGVKTVINNRHASETPDFDEKAIVEGLGMTYISLPYNGEAELTDEVFARARELFACAERPILMHCGSGNRTGALWLAYRALDAGLSLDAAIAEAKAVGLKSTAYEARAVDYVKRTSGK